MKEKTPLEAFRTETIEEAERHVKPLTRAEEFAKVKELLQERKAEILEMWGFNPVYFQAEDKATFLTAYNDWHLHLQEDTHKAYVSKPELLPVKEEKVEAGCYINHSKIPEAFRPNLNVLGPFCKFCPQCGEKLEGGEG